MARISKNFTMEELCHSNHKDVENTPSLSEKQNLIDLVENVLQPLRDAMNCTITVNSGYRSPILNKKVGGAVNSDHVFGKAADITVGSKFGNELIYNWIRDNCNYKQLINEHDFEWVHVSYDKTNNKKQQLTIK